MLRMSLAEAFYFVQVSKLYCQGKVKKCPTVPREIREGDEIFEYIESSARTVHQPMNCVPAISRNWMPSHVASPKHKMKNEIVDLLLYELVASYVVVAT